MATGVRKQQRPAESDTYELIYWPSIPGRGEHVRLALEEAGVPYTDTAHAESGVATVRSHISTSNMGDAASPPPLAPPILKHGGLTLSQTPNILLYLGARLGLAPDAAADPGGPFHVHALALTVLDGLCTEAHDTHHPVAASLYYEEQQAEARRRSRDYLASRLPKFLAYCERVLAGPASKSGEWLYGGALSYADLALFQGLDGVMHAFPKSVAKMRESGQYERVFLLYERVKARPNIKAYLQSGRRQAYGMGIWRHYPELDVVDDEEKEEKK
jgi:glutathione S-transferase